MILLPQAFTRQVTERMECNVVMHPPPSMYTKAGNGALRDQWAIKYQSKWQSYNRIYRARFGPLKLWHIRKYPPRVQVEEITVDLCFCNLIFCSSDTLYIKMNF